MGGWAGGRAGGDAWESLKLTSKLELSSVRGLGVDPILPRFPPRFAKEYSLPSPSPSAELASPPGFLWAAPVPPGYRSEEMPIPPAALSRRRLAVAEEGIEMGRYGKRSAGGAMAMMLASLVGALREAACATAGSSEALANPIPMYTIISL